MSRMREANLIRILRVALLASVLLALVVPAAQAAATRLWVKRYSGPAEDVDEASSIAFDNEGNVYVAGRSVGTDTDFDYLVIKYGPGGWRKWMKSYDRAGLPDKARRIVVDGSGNIYVTGLSFGNGTDGDFATIKYDSSGSEKWVRRYTSSGSKDDEVMDIALDTEGNVIVTGFVTGAGGKFDFLTIKYGPDGSTKWVKQYDGPGDDDDMAYGVAVDSHNNVYVTGGSWGDGTSWDYCTIKYGPGGWVKWVKRWDSGSKRPDGATDIVVDTTDLVYVTGYSYRNASDCDYVTIQYAADGTKKWERRYEGPAGGVDQALAIAYGDGRIYVTGSSVGSGTDKDYATVCYMSSGAQQWIRRYNGPAGGADVAIAIAALNGRVYVTGFSNGNGTSADIATIAYGAGGWPKWSDRYNGTGNAFDQGNAIRVNPANGNVYVTGGSRGLGTRADFVTIGYAP